MYLKNHIVCKLETILNRHDIIEAKTDLIVYLMTFFTLIVICNLKDYCPLCKRIKLTKGGDVSTFLKQCHNTNLSSTSRGNPLSCKGCRYDQKNPKNFVVCKHALISGKIHYIYITPDEK